MMFEKGTLSFSHVEKIKTSMMVDNTDQDGTKKGVERGNLKE